MLLTLPGRAIDAPTALAGHRLAYRAEIDGLRTVAVVPVVLFHAGLSSFSGGFVGVDVFFVISGYLITGILLRDLETGFSIREFYERRIRRILPALGLVLLISTLAGLIFLTPSALSDYGRSLAAVGLFGSNFHFWRSVGYFTSGAHVQPLLHTWSLAVEEQFYIFYPLLLWLIHRWRLPLVPILAAGGAISLLAAVLLLPSAQGAVFYLLPTRAWELTAGGLLAALPLATGRWARFCAPVGLMLIGGSVLLYSPQTPFPGLAAVPPVLGAVLVIWGSGGWAHRLLSSAPFVAIGKASYSFYLWHFPIFAYATYLLNRPLDPATGLILSLVSLAAAFATLRWIETPVRRSRSAKAVLLPLAVLPVACAVGFALPAMNGLPDRLSASARLIADTANDRTRHHADCMSVDAVIVMPENACLLGDTSRAPHVLLWGDSHALVSATSLEAAARRRGASFLFSATADCPPGLGFWISNRFEPALTRAASYRFCAEYNRRMMERASDPSIRSVVISARWSNWRIGEPGNAVEEPVDVRLADVQGTAPSLEANAAIFRRGFLELTRALAEQGKRVYLIGPVPEPAFNVPQALFVARFGLANVPAAIPVADYERRHAHALSILREAAAIPGVTLLEPQPMLCDASGCPLERDGVPAYLDHNHLSVSAARRVSPVMDAVFDD